MIRELTNKEKRLIELAQRGGKDSELLLLNEIENIEEKFEKFKQKIDDSIKEIKEQISPSSQEIKAVLKQTEMLIQEFSSTERIKGDKGDIGNDGIDGKNYLLTEQDKKEIAQNIKVPIVEQIIEKTIVEQPIITNEIKEVAITETAEKIRDKLETLKGDNRLNKNAIKGLEEEIEKLKKSMRTGKGTLGGVLNVGMRVEIPEGTVNGINTIFTAYKIPKFIVGDGITYYENNGYTISGSLSRTITMNIPPSQYIRNHY